MTPINAACRQRLQWGWVSILLLGLLLGGQASASQATVATTRPVQPVHAPRTVLVMGDSLSAGYGLGATQGWVPLTAQRIAQDKPGWRVVNASISGETTSGGAVRVVDEVVRVRPDIVIIELGANDGLRGLPVRQTRHNLAYMIGAAQGVGAKVLLVGMRLPPNYGADYTQSFEQMYRDLAQRFQTAFAPFLLEPVMREPNAFQPDNLHPTARMQPLIRDYVWNTLAPMLEDNEPRSH